MLETIKLSKNFKDKKVVDEINLFLGEGESVGLLGPNGAGKSTTISMISSLLKPTSGDVKLNGKSMIKDAAEMRRILGVVPQEIALYEELSAYENLKFFGRAYQVPKDKIEDRIQNVLEMVGLKDRQKELIKTFSGGMKRRINIAAALLHEPKILIFDEPTVGIDPQSRNHILETVRELNVKHGTTVLYTSHYMEEVEQLCNRVYIMDHGKVIASGTKSELLSILSSEDTIQVQLNKKSDVLLTEIKSFNHVYQVDETDEGLRIISRKGSNILSDLVHAAEKAGIQIVNYQVEIPSLEDVFLHLTGKTLRD
ncbi:ABC transporter ATP-binding protein [Cytobacillus oceanisediminis]|uniref:ABC transporter ATP-binding protein n=2 Tax=Niallia TaxID=2837506 RepID=A0A941GPT5_NIACI|nr:MULTISPECIES: ABC transporter ATP-binding protein [Bacillaceae]EOR22414.1 multidrug ABC transporter ATP-binding protein [Niallia nealsonii AAU1]MBZ9533295.1 ABC transporter ATP-binding protein [Cytobacillus oceanisediminis]MCB5239637.1 ABC transporter ATP-binding protein [Niallia circulans]MED3794308.1 ABC transporter ATP-binding protein [Niallia alba]NMO76505.1 ABC transporter ATP-binding protein [Niallia alba]